MISVETRKENLIYRNEIFQEDIVKICGIIESTGFFTQEEIGIALDVAKEGLEKGMKSGYYFLFLERDGVVIGYTCFGPITGTAGSFNLYWIAIHNNFRGEGFGKILLKKAESIIKEMGGRRIYIETSSRKQYKPTRLFYKTCGYSEEGILKDYYSKGDSKVFFVKEIHWQD